MKKYLHNDFCLCCPALRNQPDSGLIVALGSTVIVGFVLQLTFIILNRQPLGQVNALPLKPRLSCPGLLLLILPRKRDLFVTQKKESATMLRRILVILVMTPLILAALATDTSFPVLLLMISLFLIAVLESSKRDEIPDQIRNRGRNGKNKS